LSRQNVTCSRHDIAEKLLGVKQQSLIIITIAGEKSFNIVFKRRT